YAYGQGAASEYWCTSALSPNSRDLWLGSITVNKAVTTTSAETTSIYLLDSIEINPQWIVDLGARWDKFDTELKTNATGVKIENNTEFFAYIAGLTFKPVENG